MKTDKELKQEILKDLAEDLDKLAKKLSDSVGKLEFDEKEYIVIEKGFSMAGIIEKAIDLTIQKLTETKDSEIEEMRLKK